MIFKKTLFSLAVLCYCSCIYAMYSIPTTRIKRGAYAPKDSLVDCLKTYDSGLGAYKDNCREGLKKNIRYCVKYPCLATVALGGITIFSKATQCAVKNGFSRQLCATIGKQTAIVAVTCALVARVGSYLSKLITRRALSEEKQIGAAYRARLQEKFTKRARFFKNAGELQELVDNNDHYENSDAANLAATLKEKARDQLLTWQQLPLFQNEGTL